MTVQQSPEIGANRIDAAAAGLGAGAGNTPMEVFIAVCARMGIETGVDVFKIQDVAEDLVVPIMDHIIRIDLDSACTHKNIGHCLTQFGNTGGRCVTVTTFTDRFHAGILNIHRCMKIRLTDTK
jgi:hypothetical protein